MIFYSVVMRSLLIFLGLFLTQSLIPTTPLHEQLQAAAEKGDFTAMKQLLIQGASCSPAALSRFFLTIAAEQKPISDAAVDVATQLFPRIEPGINGNSAINQTSCVSFMKGKVRIGYTHYLPLTWMIENYACGGNAEKIANLLIKHGAEIDNPLVCATKSAFEGWSEYLAKHRAVNTAPLAPVADSADQK